MKFTNKEIYSIWNVIWKRFFDMTSSTQSPVRSVKQMAHFDTFCRKQFGMSVIEVKQGCEYEMMNMNLLEGTDYIVSMMSKEKKELLLSNLNDAVYIDSDIDEKQVSFLEWTTKRLKKTN